MMKKFYSTFLFILGFGAFIMAQAPPPKFLNEIKIPPKIIYAQTGTVYDLDVIQTTHDFNPHDPSDPLNGVTTFAFEDFNNPGTTSILGPTIFWNYKDNLSPTVLNALDERTTCHWHGAHVPQSADGGPYQVIQPDSLWNPSFQVLDKSATMWYHPHAMGLTYKHVQMGLSGIIIVEDPENDLDDPDDDILAAIHQILPTDYGVDDFPIIFQTKKFENVNGQMQIKAEGGFKNGYEYMVNGIIDPYMNVPANMVRLRMLNGDGKFSFNFSFDWADGSDFPAQMIATDAGYMDKSYQLSEILMAPGERTEWLLDLRGLSGDTLYVRNMVSDIPFSDMPCANNGRQGIIGDSCTTGGYAADRNLLQLIIGPPANSASPIISFPIDLLPLETPPMSAVTRERNKKFRDGLFMSGNNSLFSIDSALMDMTVVNDTVLLDATEVWTIDNQTLVAHPWHIHDIHFWITEVIDENGNPLIKEDYPALFNGPKDNVLIQPGWKLSYITTFSDYGTPILATNSYMYHCHILPHEDAGMMGTFVVWDGTDVVGVEDDLSTVPMNVFPNPSQGIIYLQGSSAKESTLRIMNLDGKLLKEMSLPSFSGAIQLDTDQLPEGMVIMDWQTAEGKATSKIVISR